VGFGRGAMIKHELYMMREFVEGFKEPYFRVELNAYSLNEFEAQKLFRAIENMIDGIMPEDEMRG
jgi:hypothetical protein